MSRIVGSIPFGNPEPWTDLARCKETGPDDETWFPEKWGRGTDAKKICASCEVRQECLQYALDNGERAGVWGGLNTKERDLLRRGTTGRTFHRPGCPCAVCTRRRSA